MTEKFTEPLPMDFAMRIAALRPAIEHVGAEALLVTELNNIRYLTGFTGSAGVVLVTGSKAFLATDGRYRVQAAEQLEASGVSGLFDLVIGGLALQRESVAGALEKEGVSTLALEAEHVSWAGRQRWAEAVAPAETIQSAGLVEGIRLVKDTGEISRMERAAQIADAALGQVLSMLSERPTERQFALALDGAMRALGAEDRAFETIVGSGPNSAKPHARPTDRVVVAGDPVVVDFGATFEGYRSDMTRTFCIGGEPTGELARIFSVVSSAQRAGTEAVAPGVLAGAVDKICRDMITEAGWAERFEHGTGHGVGLDIHEAPAVGAGAAAILSSGVVVTVEPGVYLAEIGGVRIEDTLVVTDNGSRPLTRFPKDVPV